MKPFFLFFILLFIPVVCFAEVFMYQDNAGKWHGVSSINEVPQEYRSQTNSVQHDDPELTPEQINEKKHFKALEEAERVSREKDEKKREEEERNKKEGEVNVSDIRIVPTYTGSSTGRLIGLVKNNTNRRIAFIKVTAKFYDSEGRFSDVQWTYSNPTRLDVGQEGSFELFIEKRPNIDYSQTKYSTEWNW